ncbi:MAG: type II methionyl aminopeptidase [Candidatus Pacearchaeota archaeon]|jgi:methionyl aminopeptidase
MNQQELADYKKAGEIAIKVVAYAKEIIKANTSLLEIAQKIHKKIEDLNAIAAFPVNLSIDDVAAHYHPVTGDETKATGLLKVDIGVHVNGFVADTAFSIDLTPDNKYKELIQSSEKALENSLRLLEKNPDSTLNEIGKIIQETIEDNGFSPVVNLSGHGLEQYEIHAEPSIPNYANEDNQTFKSGAYAIEPFATTGQGKIYEGPSSNIFAIISEKNTRNPSARKILEYVIKKYKTLPFSLREIQEKFGAMSRLAIKQMVQEGILHDFPQLIEKSHKPVSQTEHTFIKEKNKIIITTRQQ